MGGLGLCDHVLKSIENKILASYQDSQLETITFNYLSTEKLLV